MTRERRLFLELRARLGTPKDIDVRSQYCYIMLRIQQCLIDAQAESFHERMTAYNELCMLDLALEGLNKLYPRRVTADARFIASDFFVDLLGEG